MIVAGTGHRPENCISEVHVRNVVSNKLRLTEGVSTFICGMAAGFDLWSADEALKLGIEVWAAKPWTGHTWRKADEELYKRVEENSSRIINIIDQETYPGVWVYHNRDKWMVDHCDVVMAYWNGYKKGGTYGTYEYAKSKDKRVANVINDPPF